MRDMTATQADQMAEDRSPGQIPALDVFRYRAVEMVTGRIRTGERSGASRYEVRAALRRVGLEVEHLEIVRAASVSPWMAPLRDAWQARARRRRRFARADLCEGIATLLQSGVPLEQALSALASAPSRPFVERRMLTSLRDRLREGHSLSEICAQFPEWFDRFDIALIEAGQRAGDLATTLTSLAQYHQRAGAIAQKLLIALAYPTVLLIAGIGVVEFMALNTLPQLLALITQARQEPPWLSVQLVAFGQGLAHWWPVVIGAFVALAFGLRALIRRIPSGGRLA
ncbi:MAG: type II secretion system F family protein, partial [Betaproteobacteria bacterium]|nr:type II secretion system F family protein [Betaproteobacteria bacterium]